MDDIELVAAYLAQRLGGEASSSGRLEEVLAFETGWLKPSEARQVVSEIQRRGLWFSEPGASRLRADPRLKEVTLPLGWKPRPPFPTSGERPSGPPPLRDRLRERLSELEPGTPPEQLEERIRQKAKELLVSWEAAALLRLYERGQDIRSFLKEFQASLETVIR